MKLVYSEQVATDHWCGHHVAVEVQAYYDLRQQVACIDLTACCSHCHGEYDGPKRRLLWSPDGYSVGHLNGVIRRAIAEFDAWKKLPHPKSEVTNQ
ncbi:MAG TPA: hypothetical protein VFT22_27680 [Kofleriaceae bacterium]|nr:hypothetical protein [Kofleriaceae bacterium]